MKKGEIVFSAVCVAFFGFMLSQTFELMGQGRAGEVGSGFWPLLSLAAATALSAVWLLRNLAAYARKKPQDRQRGFAGGHRRYTGPAKEGGAERCLPFGYIVLMPWIGFILSTISSSWPSSWHSKSDG